MSGKIEYSASFSAAVSADQKIVTDSFFPCDFFQSKFSDFLLDKLYIFRTAPHTFSVVSFVRNY